MTHEGAADFLGELISGQNINRHLHDYGDKRERELWAEFKKDMAGNKVNNWLYNGGTIKGRPADLGYYVGHKVADAYFQRAMERKQAIKDILTIKDSDKFLADSRYEEKVGKDPSRPK